MKALSAVLPVAGMLLALAALSGSAALKRLKPENAFFSGKETVVDVTHPGRAETETGKVFVHGMVRRARDITNDERVNGELTIEANACLDPATSCGALWGTFVLQNPAGKWLAAWIGKKTTYGTTIYAMGYGIELYQGLLANWTYTGQGPDEDTDLDIQGFVVRTIKEKIR